MNWIKNLMCSNILPCQVHNNVNTNSNVDLCSSTKFMHLQYVLLFNMSGTFQLETLQLKLIITDQ